MGVGELADAGLDHVQISIQDSEQRSADHIAGYGGAFARKRALATEVVRLKLPLTVNAVMPSQVATPGTGREDSASTTPGLDQPEVGRDWAVATRARRRRRGGGGAHRDAPSTEGVKPGNARTQREKSSPRSA